MSERNTSEQAACDDVVFSIALTWFGLYTSIGNLVESDWLGLFGTALLTIIGGLWLAVRVYHFKHNKLNNERY